jgi:hypothetical protein
MSRRNSAIAGHSPENWRFSGLCTIGARFAYYVSMRGAGALLCAMSLVLAGGCLVTNQVELPPDIVTPPIVMAASTSLPLGSVIRFNAKLNADLQIPIKIRYDDTTEHLKIRWRTVTGGAGTLNQRVSDFDCPEPDIVPNGLTIRETFTIRIEPMNLQRGACSRVDIVVSAAFRACKDRPDLFDVTADEDNDLGRAVFWVWEVSGDPLTMEANQMLLSTCPTVTIDRSPPSTPTEPLPTQP